MSLKHFIFLIAIFNTSLLMSQNRLSGRVVNETGEPLISASVFLHGTDYAAVTDEDGEFVLDGIDSNEYQLRCTYIGYKSHKEYIDIDESFEIEIILEGSPFQVAEIEITAAALGEESPYAYSDLDKEQIDFKNIAQDLPYLLEHTPSMVVTSDAGAGIGYTYMRIRGTDPTGINVTINGVPLNDSESHGVFWVNLPDFANSVDEIQVQRGAGPSTNGAGAFGGSIGLNTNKINQNPSITFNGTYGSFNTKKISAELSTGLINNRFTLDGRYSLIQSDGYIDRATSDLQSYFFSAAEIGENHSLRFNLIAGQEVTYQAWNGVPQVKLFGTEEELLEHYNLNSNGDYNTVQDSINLFESGRTYNAYTYENQVDDYRQNHYQLVYALRPSDKLNLNATAHYTAGQGFFETFRFDEDIINDYPGIEVMDIDGEMITDANLIRRKWLKNDFFGVILDSEYEASDALQFKVGGAANRYLGDHFGKVIFVEGAVNLNPLQNYYFNQSVKDDYNVYGKAEYEISSGLNTFVDLQYRVIDYDAEGLDDSGPVDIDETYNFFNPKVGLSYQLNDQGLVYASFAVAQREPTRSDFVDAIGTGIPRSERLHDLEVGYRGQVGNVGLESNIYFMNYTDQLVLTGAVNNVGGPIRTNVDNSYRAGIELSGTYQVNARLDARANLTLSRNKIDQFDQVIFDFANGVPVVTQFNDSDIAFSPNIVGGSQIDYKATDKLTVSWLSKYVGRQFLDNTSTEAKSINPFWVNDLLINYQIKTDYLNNLEAKFLVNNILDTKYESNGYTYSYDFLGVVTETYLYPQAGINFLLGLELSF
jgi:iron complex outermembrane receptor protein